MGRLVCFMHLSLDGYTAGPNGEMDWIKVGDRLFAEAKMQTDRSGTALYGRKTFEMMDGYWPTAGDEPDASQHDKEHSAWYNTVKKVVVSATLKERDGLQLIRHDLERAVKELKDGADTDIVLFGSPGTCRQLIAAGLIDDYRLFINPILLGQGIPLFPIGAERAKLQLMSRQQYDNGVLAVHYRAKQD